MEPGRTSVCGRDVGLLGSTHFTRGPWDTQLWCQGVLVRHHGLPPTVTTTDTIHRKRETDAQTNPPETGTKFFESP